MSASGDAQGGGAAAHDISDEDAALQAVLALERVMAASMPVGTSLTAQPRKSSTDAAPQTPTRHTASVEVVASPQRFLGEVARVHTLIHVDIAYHDANHLVLKLDESPVHPAFKAAVLDMVPNSKLGGGHLAWRFPWFCAAFLRKQLDAIQPSELQIVVAGINNNLVHILAHKMWQSCARVTRVRIQAAFKTLHSPASKTSDSPGDSRCEASPASITPINLPGAFKTQLRDFQVSGVRFAIDRAARVLIGDEMGTGKTCQAIAISRHYWRDWPALVLVPSSLRWIWAAELTRWLPELQQEDVCTVTGEDSARGVLLQAQERVAAAVPSDPKAPLKDDTLWPFAKATRRAAAAAAPPGTAGPSSGKARAAAAVPALTVMSYTLFQRWTDYVWSKRLTAEQQAWFRQANRRYSRQRAGYRSGGSAPPGEGATSSDKVHTSAQWAVGQVAGSFGSGSRGLHGALASSKAPGSREPDAVADGSTIGGSQRVAHSGKPSAFFDMLGRAVAQCMPTLICDEAHYLRDLSAQRTSSAVAVATHAKRVLLLTGTPAFARPIDIFPLLHALQPKAFPSKHAFGLRYCRGQMRTIRAGGGRRSAGGGFSVTKWTYEGASNSAELYAALESGVMVRRLKADVLKQLPPKQHQVVQLRLEGSQAIERMAGAMEKEVARLADWRHMQWQDAVAAAKEAASGAGGSPVKRQKGGAAGGRAGAGDGWDSGAELKPHLEAADAAGLLGGDGDLTSFNSSRDLTSFFSTAGKCTGKAMDASCLTSASSGTPQKSPPAMRRPPAGAARHSIPASFADDCLLQLAAANRVPGYASYGYSLALEAAAEEDEGVEGGLGDASDDEQGTRTAAETSFLAASSQYKPAVSGASAPITELSDPGDDDAEAVQVAELDPTGMDRWQATGVVKAPLVAQYLVQLLDGAGGGGAAGGGEGGDVTKVLVFAHHQAVLDTLQGELVKNKLVFVRIDGNCSMQERLASLKRFQREAAVVVALVSMTAGGEGLSYTAANVVLFAELHYVPGIMLQAEDRAHRLSSIAARNSAEFDNGGRVTIRYLLSHGTYDDTLWPRILKRLRGIGASVNGAEIDLKASLHRFVGKKLTDATQDTMSSGASASGVDGAGPAPGTQHTDVASGVDAATHTVTQNSAESRMAEQGEVLGVRSLLFRVDAVTGVARVYTQLGMYTGRHVATDDGALLSARPQDYPQVACNGAACLISKQRLFKTPAPAAVMAAAGLGGGAGHGAAPGGAHLLPLPSTRPPVPPAGCICWLAAAAVFAQQWCAMAPITQRELSGPLLRLPLDEQLKAVVRRDLGLDTSAVSLAEEGTDEGGVGGGAGAVASAASRHRITNERYAAMHSGVVPLSQVQQLAAANAADSDSSDSTDALMTQITGHSRGGQPNSAAASSGRLNDSVLPAAPPASGPAPVSCAHCGSELQHALALSVVGDGAQVLAQRALLQGGAGAAGGKKRRRPTIFALLSDSSSDDASDTSESDTGDGAEGQGGGGAQGQVLGEGGVASREALAGLADSAQVDPTKLYVLPFCNDKCSKAYWGRRKSDRIRAYVGQLEMGVCQLCGFRARDVWRHVASLHRSELQQLQEASARARLRLRRQCRRATAESALVKQELPNAFPQLRSAEAGVLDSIARASTATLRALLRCRRAYKRSQRALQDAKRTAATDRGDFLRRLSRKQWTAPARFGSTWPCAHKCQGLGWRPRAREGDVYVSPGLALDPNEGAFWQADHLLPVVEGGGASGWCNLRTLCTECHREVTSALRRRMSVLGTGRGGKGGAVLDKVALMRQAAREGGAGAASLGTAGVRSGSLPGMFKRARHNASGDSSAGSPGQLLRAEFGTAGRAGKATSQHGAGRGQEDEEVFVDLVSSDDE